MEYYNGTEFDRERLGKVFQEYIDKASLWQKQEGSTWYYNAHKYARHLAKRYGYTVEQTAAAISTLSPGTRWEINMRDAEEFCKAAVSGDAMPPATTYGPQQQKAWAILTMHPNKARHMSGADWEDYIGTDYAKKTKAFYWNVLAPDRKEVVTIDRWIMRAAGIDKDSPTLKQYDAIAEAIIDLARKYRTQAHKVQAVIWLVIKDEWQEQAEAIPF